MVSKGSTQREGLGALASHLELLLFCLFRFLVQRI